MPFSRRRLFRFFRLGFVLSLWPSWSRAQAHTPFAPSHLSGDQLQVLKWFLDCLLPADEWSGSATELQVDRRLLVVAERQPALKLLLIEGSDWLLQTTSGRYRAQTAEQVVVLINGMAADNPASVPRRFFDATRHLAIELYYSQQASWSGMSLNHPPQPRGYVLPAGNPKS